jgi:hypothetical protein
MTEIVIYYGLCELWFIGFIWFWIGMCYYQRSLKVHHHWRYQQKYQLMEREE